MNAFAVSEWRDNVFTCNRSQAYNDYSNWIALFFFLTASRSSAGLPRIPDTMAYNSPIRFSASVVLAVG